MTPERGLNGLSAVIVIALGAISLVGCSSNPIKKWQSAVEQHVIDRGQGDMNSVRTASPEGNRFDFVDRRAKLREMFPSNRRDVHAIVLGRTAWQDQSWQVFLLGVVHYSGVLDRFPLDAKDVDDIRLAVARVEPGGKLAWILGEADPENLAMYLSAQDSDTPGFPTPRDRISFVAEGSVLRAVDENSGATWTLGIDQ